MAQPQQGDCKEIGFRNVQLFKAQSLGIGSYGAVCKAKCDDLLCAAKLLHPILFDPTARALASRQREHRLPISRFEQECQLLSSIKHPNIVQHLGTLQDPENGLPVLLMELMDESLTSFLERSQRNLPYHIEVTISHDIALALSFLHSNGIIHRDLSSNNVLMIGNSRAKVTDFGMAKLAGANPQATRVSLTQTPGADVYMSPEATQIPPVYSEKIDCFSHGVLGVQIMTRQFPNPGNRYNRIQIQDPRFPRGSIEVRVAEVERRQEHISLINQTHPLVAVALDCLKDEEGERPSAQEICDRLVALKQAPQFTQSVREQATPQQSAADEGAVRQSQKEQIPFTRDLQIKRRERGLLETDGELQQLRKQVREYERLITEYQQASQRDERRIRKQQQQLKHQSAQPEAASSGGAEGPLSIIKLKWREGKKALRRMARVSNAVVHGSVMYCAPNGVTKVYGYDSTIKNWFQLPDCQCEYFSLAVVDNLLTAIGGLQAGRTTNALLSLTGKGWDSKWVKTFPPMPTKCYCSCAVSSGTALIVIGGKKDTDTVLRTVQVMDSNTKDWTTAASLPEPLHFASATICGDRIFVLGASIGIGSPSKAVFTCSLSTLLQSCQSKSVAGRMKSLVVSDSTSCSAWSKVADLPVTESTCIAFHGRLLAIGGRDSCRNPTTAVRIYDPVTKTWNIISHMITPRWWCFAAVLPENELIVVGGGTKQDRRISDTDCVEVASL